MGLQGRHVRNEIKTRERYGLVGNGESLPNTLGVAWCGPEIPAYEWKFLDPTHVLHALSNGTGIQPCRACLREIRDLLNIELGEK